MDQNRPKNKNKVNSFKCIAIKKVLEDQKYYSLKTGSNRIKQDQNWSKWNKAQKLSKSSNVVQFERC